MTCAIQGSTVVEVEQGEAVTLQLNVVDQDGEAVDIADATLWFTVKRKPGDSRVLISKTSTDPSKIEKQLPTTDGIANIMLVHDDTKGLAPGTYAFDVWLQYDEDNVHPLFEPSAFIVTPTVTTFA